MIVAVVLSSFAVVALAHAASRTPALSGTVVFVCAHGNVKSLIAREWFPPPASALQSPAMPCAPVSRFC